ALSRQLRSARHVLPTEQPTHKLRRRYRRNFPPQPSQSKPVNPRQQSPSTPLRLRASRICKLTAQHRPASLDLQQRLVDFPLRHAKYLRERSRRHGTAMLHPSSHKLTQNLLKTFRPLRSHPIPSSRSAAHRRSSLSRKFLKQSPPRNNGFSHRTRKDTSLFPNIRLDLRHCNQCLQYIVKFICIPRVRPRFRSYFRNCCRIQLPDFPKHRFRQHPPHLHSPRSAFLQRRVIQIRKRVCIQNLV